MRRGGGRRRAGRPAAAAGVLRSPWCGRPAGVAQQLPQGGAGQGQDELFPVWRYHAVFTDSPFTLLADEDATVSKMYGVYKQRNLYGKKYMGIERTTFVIDKTGRIAQIYPKVKVEGHIENLLEFLGED